VGETLGGPPALNWQRCWATGVHGCGEQGTREQPVLLDVYSHPTWLCDHAQLLVLKQENPGLLPQTIVLTVLIEEGKADLKEQEEDIADAHMDVTHAALFHRSRGCSSISGVILRCPSSTPMAYGCDTRHTTCTDSIRLSMCIHPGSPPGIERVMITRTSPHRKWTTEGFTTFCPECSLPNQ